MQRPGRRLRVPATAQRELGFCVWVAGRCAGPCLAGASHAVIPHPASATAPEAHREAVQPAAGSGSAVGGSGGAPGSSPLSCRWGGLVLGGGVITKHTTMCWAACIRAPCAARMPSAAANPSPPAGCQHACQPAMGGQRWPGPASSPSRPVGGVSCFALWSCNWPTGVGLLNDAITACMVLLLHLLAAPAGCQRLELVEALVLERAARIMAQEVGALCRGQCLIPPAAPYQGKVPPGGAAARR